MNMYRTGELDCRGSWLVARPRRVRSSEDHIGRELRCLSVWAEGVIVTFGTAAVCERAESLRATVVD